MITAIWKPVKGYEGLYLEMKLCYTFQVWLRQLGQDSAKVTSASVAEG